MPPVKFDDEYEYEQNVITPEKPGLRGRLIEWNLARNTRQADIILIVVLVILVIIIAFSLRSLSSSPETVYIPEDIPVDN